MNTELDVETVVRTATLRAMRLYPDTDPEDLYQEAQLWVAEHPDQVERYKGMRFPATAASYMARDICRKLEVFGRKEKAFHAGYEVADEYTYTVRGIEMRGLIAECLRAIVTGTREPAKLETEGPSNVDPAEASNNFLVSMLDIEKGWNGLAVEDQKLLAAFFVYGVSAVSLAEQYGVSDQRVYAMLKSALKRMVGPLNGVK